MSSAEPELTAGRALVGRVSVSVIDQGLSTATNLLITLVAAGVLGVRDFGTFGVAYLVAVTATGSVRAAIASPALFLQEDAARDDAAGPLGSTLLTGLVVAAGVGGAGLLAGGHLRLPLLALAVTLPGMLVQDTGRLVEFAALQPVRALVLDVIWAVGLVGGLVGVAAFADLTPAVLVAVWGGSGTISGLWSLWRHGRRIPMPSTAWIRHTWYFAWRYLIVFASTLGVFQITTLVLGGISGVTAVGVVRATQVLFGPIQNLATAMLVAFVPEISLETPLRDQRARLLFVSAALTVVALGITAVALVMPDSLGEALLGDSWDAARGLILPAGISAAMFGATSGAVIGLRAARAAHETLVIGLQMTAFQAVIPTLGAVLDDERGFLWSMVLVWVIGSLVWWRCYLAIEARGPEPLET